MQSPTPQVLVTAVAQVGVDINLAANVVWRREALQFVPGLGPRKARSLLEAVQRNNNKVESRNEMYRELGVLGKTVLRRGGRGGGGEKGRGRGRPGVVWRGHVIKCKLKLLGTTASR